MRAILIDPEARTIKEIELPNSDRALSEAMQRLIGDDYGLDWGAIDYKRDTLWSGGGVLLKNDWVYAFKLPSQREPFAGSCIIIGSNPAGDTLPPEITVKILEDNIVWLGQILPEVTTIAEETDDPMVAHIRRVVTYERKK